MTLTAFLVFASLLFFFLGIIWSRNTAFNVILKIVLLSGAIWGGFVTLQHLGYIIKQ